MGNRHAYNQQYQNHFDQNMIAQQNLQASRVAAQNQYPVQSGYYETPQYYSSIQKQKNYSQIPPQIQAQSLPHHPSQIQAQRQSQIQSHHQSQIPQYLQPQIQPQKSSKIENYQPLKPQYHHSFPSNPTQSHIFVPPLQNSRIIDPIKSSIVGSQPIISSQIPPQLFPEVRLTYKPEAGKSGSIINKNHRPNTNVFKMDQMVEKIDNIRTFLRDSESKMIMILNLALENEIQEMDRAIEKERSENFRDKNRVVFILKEKNHYHKLCLEFKEFNEKIRSTLLYLRKLSSLSLLTQDQLLATIRLKDAVEASITAIEKDLPHKGWKALINKPTSKHYLAIVTSGLQDPEIMKRYNELQTSLSNPEVLKQIASEEMLYSKSRKIRPEQTTEQTAKKLIEGPAHYRNTEMRGTKYPIK